MPCTETRHRSQLNHSVIPHDHLVFSSFSSFRSFFLSRVLNSFSLCSQTVGPCCVCFGSVSVCLKFAAWLYVCVNIWLASMSVGTWMLFSGCSTQETCVWRHARQGEGGRGRGRGKGKGKGQGEEGHRVSNYWDPHPHPHLHPHLHVPYCINKVPHPSSHSHPIQCSLSRSAAMFFFVSQQRYFLFCLFSLCFVASSKLTMRGGEATMEDTNHTYPANQSNSSHHAIHTRLVRVDIILKDFELVSLGEGKWRYGSIRETSVFLLRIL